jgi:hypothetical protein
VYADVNAVAAGPEGMTATAYLVKDGVTYGTYDMMGMGNGTASALMTLPEDLDAGTYQVYVTNVDLGVGVPGMIDLAPLTLTVTEAPSPTDRIGELEDQLDDLKDRLDGKLDAWVGYVILVLVIVTLVLLLLQVMRRK